MKGDYEVFHALRRQKNKANSKPITNTGSDVEWIPAFVGMTNMESQRQDEKKEFEKTKPILNRQNEHKYLYIRGLWGF